VTLNRLQATLRLGEVVVVVVVAVGEAREVVEGVIELLVEEVMAAVVLSSPLLPTSTPHPGLASLKTLSEPMTVRSLPPLSPKVLALMELPTITLCSVDSITTPSPTPPLNPSPTSPDRLLEMEAKMLLLLLPVLLAVLLDMLLRLVSCVWRGVAGGMVVLAKVADGWLKAGGGGGEV
jgi:hypothetical protein